MTEVLAAVLGAILGALLAGYLNFVTQSKALRASNQTSLTVKLYEEWHSASMLEARIRAFQILRDHPANSFTELQEDLLATGREDDSTKLSRLLHFFELLGMLLQ